MLDTDTKRCIDTARDILVCKMPDPKSQVGQITIALVYKFMNGLAGFQVAVVVASGKTHIDRRRRPWLQISRR